MAVAWEQQRAIPRGVASALGALRFDTGAPAAEVSLDDAGWQRTLSELDRMRLTLLAAQRWNGAMPGPIRARVERNVKQNEERLRRLESVHSSVSDALTDGGVEFVTLRGLTHREDYVADPRLRCQYDIDLLCDAASLGGACKVLKRLGYEPLEALKGFPTDHLPTMIRKTGWQWRGDYYDPDIPFAIDLHFRLWDEGTEKFAATGTEQFWDRRSVMTAGGRCIPCLHPADMLGSAVLHVLRHLLRSSLTPSHVYEVAHFLHLRAADEAFWSTWRDLHPPPLRRLEAIGFRLAADWFGCGLPPVAREEVEKLPEPVRCWFEHYTASPVAARYRPNKDELWLHLALVECARHRRAVLLRRLAPARLPGPVDAVLVPERQMTPTLRFRRRLRYTAHLLWRALWHVRTLWPVMREAVRWRLRNAGLAASFWVFLVASGILNFGLYIFFLLYNLYLLDLGYREDFIGSVASAMTAGSIAGTLPAGALARRFGLRASVLCCIAGAAVISGARALVSSRTSLVALAFADGAVTAAWAISYLPAIARSAGEKHQPLAYTLFTVQGIGIGVAAGMIGGFLPEWLMDAGIAGSPAGGKRAALLLACGLTALAVIPAVKLRFPAAAHRSGTDWPRGAFLARFLAAVAVWSLAIGAFNPLFNAFFSRHLHFSTPAIGAVYSAAQLTQVGGLLLSPLILKRLGIVKGITAMQLATGIALASLSASPGGAAAALGYCGYMAFQSMSEPGTFTLLMSRVGQEQQSGASALNFLVVFTMNAIAAWSAGLGILHLGYPAVLAIAGATAAVGAALFRGLLGKFEGTQA